MSVAAARDLRALFAPRSVAVVGASADPMKWGHWLARDALRGADRRAVHLVNVRGGTILGQPAWPSVAALPSAPDLVVLAVPAAGLEAAVEDALAGGARALVTITAGLAELGGDGRAREAALVARVRAAGAVMLGPNCLGVAAVDEGLALGLGEPPAGPIGVISQSGNVALEVVKLAAAAGLGVTRVASIGNQADLGAAELVAALAEHEPTRVVALYLEDFRDGRALLAAIAATGKPVVVLAAGASAAGARAAASHTGALVSDRSVVDAACRAAGAVRAGSPAELVDAARLLLGPRPPGRRVAVVTDGGGHGVIAADLAERAGLELPAPGAAVAAALPGGRAGANPLDLAGAGEADLDVYARVVEAIARDGGADAILMTGYFGGYSVDTSGAVEREVAVARRLAATARRVPLIVHTMHAGSPPARALAEAGVPVFATIDAAVGALGRVAAAPAASPAPGPVEPAAPVAAGGYWSARAVIAAEAPDLPLVAARRVTSVAEALAAADDLGYPVVLKAADVLHKSDAGGVALDLRDADALAAAFAGMRAIGSATYAVERMAPAGVELLLGARRDPRFGPVVAVGLGGIFAEVLGDVAVALAPLDALAAERLLRELRGAPLLLGARGRPPVDLGAAARAVAALSRLAAAHPELAAIEVNPLRATPAGVVGLDARIVAAQRRG